MFPSTSIGCLGKISLGRDQYKLTNFLIPQEMMSDEEISSQGDYLCQARQQSEYKLPKAKQNRFKQIFMKEDQQKSVNKNIKVTMEQKPRRQNQQVQKQVQTSKPQIKKQDLINNRKNLDHENQTSSQFFESHKTSQATKDNIQQPYIQYQKSQAKPPSTAEDFANMDFKNIQQDRLLDFKASLLQIDEKKVTEALQSRIKTQEIQEQSRIKTQEVQLRTESNYNTQGFTSQMQHYQSVVRNVEQAIEVGRVAYKIYQLWMMPSRPPNDPVPLLLPRRNDPEPENHRNEPLSNHLQTDADNKQPDRFNDIARELIIDGEGLSLNVYECTTYHHTIGYGHKLTETEIGVVKVITLEQAEVYLQQDMKRAIIQAKKEFSVKAWNNLGPVRQALIVDMVYNLGNIQAFKLFKVAMSQANWEEAAFQIITTTYFKQVKDRGIRNVMIILKGIKYLKRNIDKNEKFEWLRIGR